MAVTKDQASTANEFHYNTPRDNGTCYVWRRNGATQTWATRPDEFRTPVKYGLRDYGQLTQNDAHMFHMPDSPDCPERKRAEAPKRSRARR